MNMEKLNAGNAICRQILEVEAELKVWEEMKGAHDLGVRQRWNNNHLIPLPCKHTPESAFFAYREACINALKVKKAELIAEFEAL